MIQTADNTIKKAAYAKYAAFLISLHSVIYQQLVMDESLIRIVSV